MFALHALRTRKRALFGPGGSCAIEERQHDLRKFIAIIVAIAINVAVLASLHNSSGAVVAGATPPRATQRVLTLPVITVRPSALQWRELGRIPASAGSG